MEEKFSSLMNRSLSLLEQGTGFLTYKRKHSALRSKSPSIDELSRAAFTSRVLRLWEIIGLAGNDFAVSHRLTD